MPRYKLVPTTQNRYDMQDTDLGDNIIVATFSDLTIATQCATYLNKKNEIVELIYDHVSEDLDYEFN